MPTSRIATAYQSQVPQRYTGHSAEMFRRDAQCVAGRGLGVVIAAEAVIDEGAQIEQLHVLWLAREGACHERAGLFEPTHRDQHPHLLHNLAGARFAIGRHARTPTR
jgi:hypothetical protein